MLRLISAPWVLTMAEPPLREGAVVVDGGDTVVAAGPRADLRRLHPAAPEERAEGALLPGLVNAHCHLELSALAGAMPGGAGLVPWATRIPAAAARVSPEDARAAAARAAREAAGRGTAAVGDVG